MQKNIFKKYIHIMILVLIFSLPMLAAFYLYQNPKWWRCFSTTNYGQWAPQFTWQFNEKKSRPWQLVYWYENTCSTDCLSRLDLLGRIRLAMGRKVYDLDIVLLQPQGSTSSEKIKQQLNEWNMYQQFIPADQVLIWKKLFQDHPIVLFDPEHQALLMYPPNLDAKKAYHDLQVLVK
jgi:hypothetical protein